MKMRLVAAVVFVLVALVLSLFSDFYVSSRVDEMITEIDYLSSVFAYGEIPDMSKLFGMWKDCKKLFLIFLKHADADALDIYFLTLENYCATLEYSEIPDKLSEIKAFLFVTAEGEKLKSSNIF